MPRPTKSTGRISFSAPGDYSTVQEALNNELPLIVDHTVDISIESSAEHIVVPPFVATWVPKNSEDELVPIQLKGGGNSVESFTTLGGAGVIQALDLNFTGTSPTEHGNAAVVSKDTYRVDVVNCSINNDSNGMIANGGQINGYKGTTVDTSGWGVKTTNYGRYTGKQTDGRVGGNAYVAESGFITFDERNTGQISGGKSASGNGIIINQGSNEMWGPDDVQKIKEIMREAGRYSLGPFGGPTGSQGGPSVDEWTPITVSGGSQDNVQNYILEADELREVEGGGEILGNTAVGSLTGSAHRFEYRGRLLDIRAESGVEFHRNGERLSATEILNICNGSFNSGETTSSDNNSFRGGSNSAQYKGTFVDYRNSFFESEQCTTPEEYGAAGDGSRDDSDAIKTAIENNHCVEIPEGTYRVDSTIHLENLEDKLIKGPGEIKFNSGNRGFLFRIDESQNIHFSNLSLNGNSEHDTDAAAFKFNNCRNISVNDSEIYNWGDLDGVQSDLHTIGSDSSHKAEFIGNFIHDVGAKGISWYSYEGDAQPNHKCLMADNKVRRTGEDGLFAGTVQTTERAEDIVFIDNDIKTTRDNYGIRIGGNQPIQVEIRDNRIENPDNVAITVKTLADSFAQVLNNECIGGGINFKGRPNISGKIEENTLRETEDGIRILFGCQDVEIIGNETYKILIEGGSDFLIRDNDIGDGGIVRRNNPQNLDVSSNS